MNKHCAWLSRHAPTANQQAALAAYTIHQVDPVGRCLNVRDAWHQTVLTVDGYPDLVVIVLPEYWRKKFALLAQRCSPETDLVITVMTKDDRETWSGRWKQLQLVGSKLCYVEWQP